MNAPPESSWRPRIVAVAILATALTGIASAGADDRARQAPTNAADATPTATAAATRRGPRGPRGLRGLRGLPGPVGPAGPAGVAQVTTVEGTPVPYCASSPCWVVTAQVVCPPGSVVVGGGYKHAAGGGTSIDFAIGWNAPLNNGWAVILVNNDDGGDELIAVARCASGPGVSAVRAAGAGSAADFAAQAADLRARRG